MKRSIHVGSGVVHPDYTGEIKILLLNLGTTPFKILTGNAIAQLVLEKISMPILHKVDTLPHMKTKLYFLNSDNSFYVPKCEMSSGPYGPIFNFNGFISVWNNRLHSRL